MLLRTGLSIHVQFGEFRAEGTFILSAWQPVSVALLNAAVDADNGNSALRRHITRALQIWPTPFESVVQEGITSREFRADVGPTDVSTDPGHGDTEGALVISRLQCSQNALQRPQQRLNEYL